MRVLVMIALVGLAVGCEEKGGSAADPPPSSSGPLVVYTTFYPTEYFAERIGGDLVEVECPVPEGEDPIFWMPDREAIEAYREADVILLNGAGFEKWVSTVSLPESRVVDTSAGFEDEFLAYEGTTHSHGPAGEHTHEGVDGHTWMDPLNAKRQALAIRDAFVSRAPGNEREFRVGYAELGAELDELHVRILGLVPRMRDVQVLASHPAFNYLSERHGWDVKNFDLDPEAPIDEEGWSQIAGAVDAGARVRVMLWESAPLPEVASRLAEELGVVSVTFRPCELLGADERAAGEDYMAVMSGNVDRLEAALGGADGGGGGG